MRDNLNRVMGFIFKWEGGYSNDPADPGGETKYGISKRAHPDVDIKNLTVEDAKSIYLNEYWMVLDCDNLDWPMDLVVMDVGVNMGPGRAREFQSVAEDWKEFIILRIKYYMKLKDKYPKFIFGWLNRTMDLYAYARGT